MSAKWQDSPERRSGEYDADRNEGIHDQSPVTTTQGFGVQKKEDFGSLGQ